MQAPIHRRVDKKAVVHYTVELLVGHKKEWNLTIYDSMVHLEGIMWFEISQAENEKYQMISLVGSKEQNK